MNKIMNKNQNDTEESSDNESNQILSDYEFDKNYLKKANGLINQPIHVIENKIEFTQQNQAFFYKNDMTGMFYEEVEINYPFIEQIDDQTNAHYRSKPMSKV
ncbi:hypothetical protein BpHYR1_035278 [Brachionus plicatilis]|uniref:Uncharacterized protein n=1 Tax=Brachionus plicatilis TaxID=10195 RepID=A0A3M7PXC2_BRAPC|nr:hypothetical protein BpHYR1_035278 [Brachionus plicatilis]